MSVARLLPTGCLALLATVVPGGIIPAQITTAPRFDGKSIPDPPEQGRPWTAPETRLPRFLVDATRLLFEQGVADPRGCEYREVEVGDDRLLATHGFALPPRPGEKERFAVGWDGLVYPTSIVGKAADLDADIRALADALRKGREQADAGGEGRRGNPAGFTGMARRMFGVPFDSKLNWPASVETASALKVGLLLRLGRADLAEALFAGGTVWEPGAGPDRTDYGISYPTLAADWASRAYRRAADAHGRGDDAVALDAARRVVAFTRKAGARLDELSFPRPNPNGRGGARGGPPFFPDLSQIGDLLADQERRAKEPPRGPIPGPSAPAADRVAALIRDLDQLRSTGSIMNGMTSPGGPALAALVREGDAAVEPLLAVLASDDRLTRTVFNPASRHGGDDRFIYPVYQPVFNVLTSILKTRVIPGSSGPALTSDAGARAREAAAIRAFWTANRGVPEVERYYRILADDAAGQAQWLDAAEAFAQPSDVRGRGGVYFTPGRPGGKVPPLRGEPIRDRRDPGVTALMARRVASLDPGGNGYSPFQVLQADKLASFLATWDLKGALPTLRARVARLAGLPRGPQYRGSGDSQLAIDVAEFTLLRQKGGDPGALEDYAAWVRTLTPEAYGPLPSRVFEPIWRSPGHPAIAGAADALFADPASPWVSAFLRDPGRPGVDIRSPLIGSPLLGVGPFRKLVLDGLSVTTEVGTVETDASGKANVRFPRGGYQYSPSRDDPLRPKPGTRMSVRLADDCAFSLQAIGGLARFEWYWPEPRRDERIAAAAAFLRQYGDRLAYRADARSIDDDMPSYSRQTAVTFTFDPLDHPATPADVREGRAIFSLDPAERRPWALPSFPIKARWTGLEILDDDPGLRGISGPDKRPRAQVEMLQGGLVWQAEEAREEGQWRRYYGFVGRHVRARVPAEQVEFPPAWNTGWSRLSAELDGRLIPPGGSDDGTRIVREAASIDGPMLVEVWLRNRRGVDSAAPVDWSRSEGGLSLAEGLTVRLFRVVDPPTTAPGAIPAEPTRREVPARAVRRHRSDEPARTLTPTATVRVLRFDLRDLFPVEAPGTYQVEVGTDAIRADDGRPASLSQSFPTRPAAGAGEPPRRP